MTWIVPNQDSVTLGELQGELYSVSPRDEFHIGDAFVRRGGTVFAPVRVTGLKQRRPFGQQESLTEQDLNDEDWDRQAPGALQLLKRTAKALQVFFVEDERKVARSLLESAAWFITSTFVRPVDGERDDTSAFVPANNKKQLEESISAIAWHTSLTVLAVAQRDGVVSLYDAVAGEWDTRVLAHRSQQDITSLEWSHYSGGVLAVACRGGIFLWKVPSKRQEPELLDIVTHPTKRSFQQVAWNEDGSLLAAFADKTDSVFIIDVIMNRRSELKCRQQVTAVHWSPTGAYLFVSTASGVSVMWETCTWQKETWDVAASSCAWSSNGRCLLVAHRNTSLIYPYEFPATPPLINVGINTPPIDFAEKQLFSLDKSTFEYVGGAIKSLTWDPSGTRVAVTYTPSTSSNGDVGSLVAIFSVAWTPFLIFTMSGLIRGPPKSGVPRSVTFASKFDEGALLSIAWSSGLISFHPFYFEES
ncbi:hypothetical protein Poli38472_000816 [Pythium oligandrum]|uniref:Aladin seven-bladed propeller domain-containing protein n=1 Tax=Pythium oligandrum TaxID=41045 RepID=A0A8K1CCC1_PYTOL|nr:hypothetical protein Poli38472_000816 [Pythium oligandrum]|eukprot:TMW60774.1 hypothetical protein Poli38472_000816 [Pythium oligandrum]